MNQTEIQETPNMNEMLSTMEKFIQVNKVKQEEVDKLSKKNQELQEQAQQRPTSKKEAMEIEKKAEVCAKQDKILQERQASYQTDQMQKLANENYQTDVNAEAYEAFQDFADLMQMQASSNYSENEINKFQDGINKKWWKKMKFKAHHASGQNLFEKKKDEAPNPQLLEEYMYKAEIMKKMASDSYSMSEAFPDRGSFLGTEPLTEAMRTRLYIENPMRRIFGVTPTISTKVRVPFNVSNWQAGIRVEGQDETVFDDVFIADFRIKEAQMRTKFFVPIAELRSFYEASPITSSLLLQSAQTAINRSEGYAQTTGRVAQELISGEVANYTSLLPTNSNDYYLIENIDDYEHGKIGYMSAGSNDVIKPDKVIDFAVTTLLPEYLSGAFFMCNEKTYAKLLQLKADDATYLANRINYFEKGGQMVLFGIPVVINSYLPDVEADSTPLIFVNRDAYRIYEKTTLEVRRFPIVSSKADTRHTEIVRWNGAIRTNEQAIRALRMTSE